MSDPKRWLDDPENAPDGAPELLRQGEKPPALSNAIKAASAVALANAAIGTASASLGVTAKIVAVVLAVGAGGGVALVAKHVSDSHEGRSSAPRSHEVAAPPSIIRPAVRPQMPEVPSIAREIVEAVSPAEPLQDPAQHPVQDVARSAEAARTHGPATPRTRRREVGIEPPPAIAPEHLVAPSLVEEATLLEQARGALRSDPARALSIVETHARRHPNASLRAETELIAVDALVRLGRHDEARARGEAALRADQRSLYSSRIQRILGRANVP
jgi:hypothetical protein